MDTFLEKPSNDKFYHRCVVCDEVLEEYEILEAEEGFQDFYCFACSNEIQLALQEWEDEYDG